MNLQLQQSIRAKLLASGGTTHVYYYHLPFNNLLKEYTITFELRTSENVEFFDAKEAKKNYELKINVNSPDQSKLETNSIYIKNSIYSLSNEDVVRYTKLVSEDVFWDDELSIWTLLLDFEIHED